MADFRFPDGVTPFVASYHLQPHMGLIESPFSRTFKRYVLSRPRWTCTLSFRGGESHQRWGESDAAILGAKIDAFLAKLNSGANRAELWDIRREELGSGVARGALFNEGASKGVTSVKVNGFPPNSPAFTPGDYVGGDGRSHIIIEPSTSDAAGVAWATFEPPLETDMDVGEMVYGADATSRFILTNADTAGMVDTEVGQLTHYRLEFVEDFGIAAPLSGLSTPPVLAVSTWRQLGGYGGPIMRVRNASSELLDVRNTAEATAFGATKVVGVYDQMTGGLITFDTALDYTVVNGKAAAINNGGSASGADMPAATLPKFAGITGIATFAALSVTDPLPIATSALFRISQSGSTGSTRFALRTETQSTPFARHTFAAADETATFVVPIGNAFPGTEILGYNFDIAGRYIDAYRNGRMVRERPNSWVGSVADTVPLAGRIAVHPGRTLFELTIFNQHLSEADTELMLADQRTSYRGMIGVLDGVQSWHTHEVANSYNGRTVYGFTTSLGGQGHAVFNDGSARLQDQRIIEELFYTQDDHNAQAYYRFDDGSLIAAATGHGGNPRDGVSRNRILVQRSPTGDIQDFDDGYVLDTVLARTSYLQFLKGSTRLLLFTNSVDTPENWRAFYSDNDGAGFTEGRPFITQATAPGGGFNQNYIKSVHFGPDTVGFFALGHPTNSQNPISVFEMDIPTGEISADGTDYGDAYGSPAAAPLVDLSVLPVIHTPPSGKSCRLLDATPDRLAIAEFDTNTTNTPPVTNAKHFVLIHTGGDRYDASNWVKHEVGNTAAFWASYVGSMVFAREPHEGIRVYRIWNDGGTWKLDRCESPDGVLWSVATMYSTSSYFLMRCFATGSDTMPVICTEGDYSHFTNWRVRSFGVAAPTSSEPGVITPYMRVSGDPANGSGNITPGLPEDLVEGELMLLKVETANQPVAAPSGWTQISSSPQARGTAGASNATSLQMFWKRAAASETAPTITGTTDHKTARIYAIRGAIASGTPFDVQAGDFINSATTAVTIPSVTTTGPNRLIFMGCSRADDQGTTIGINEWENSNLPGLTRHGGAGTTVGNGGGFTCASALKATAGATGTTTAVAQTSTVQARIIVAILPA